MPLSVEALLASALIALVKPDTDEGRERLRTIGDSIAAEARPVSIWPGDDGALATGLMLVAIGFHESKFAEKVRRCRPAPGKYLGLYQILPGPNTQPHTAAEVCASDVVQARLALAVLARSQRRCPRCTPSYALRAYASGDGGRDTREAREIIDIWYRAASSVGLQVYPHSRKAPHPR